jgi:hypothetical protein
MTSTLPRTWAIYLPCVIQLATSADCGRTAGGHSEKLGLQATIGSDLSALLTGWVQTVTAGRTVVVMYWLITACLVGGTLLRPKSGAALHEWRAAVASRRSAAFEEGRAPGGRPLSFLAEAQSHFAQFSTRDRTSPAPSRCCTRGDALWMGHEQPITTHGYIEADLQMKRNHCNVFKHQFLLAGFAGRPLTS